MGIRPSYQRFICRMYLFQSKDNMHKKRLEFFIKKQRTMDRPEFILPNCLAGRGGADALVGDEGLLSATFFVVTASLKKESNRPRSSLTSITCRPIRTRVSRVDNCSVFSRRRALCVASRAEGDGGRGAGFIA